MVSLWPTGTIILPKVANPSTAVDFRSITYGIAIYNYLSKLLYWRQRKVLPNLVNKSLGAFVLRREIMCNVHLCQEVTRGCKRQQIFPICVMRMDLKKAYDFICWSFYSSY